MNLWGNGNGERRHLTLVPDLAGLARHARPLWTTRDEESVQVAAWLDGYIDRLPERYRDLLRGLLAGETERDLARRLRVSPSTAWRQAERAVQALVRAIALDDPDFAAADRARRRGVRGSVPRDHEAERVAAWRVYERWRHQVCITPP